MMKRKRSWGGGAREEHGKISRCQKRQGGSQRGKEGALEEPQRVWYGWNIVLWGKKEKLESWAETIKTGC